MRIDRYISNSRIIDLSSRDLCSAYSELLDTFGSQLATPASRKKVLKELVAREKSLTSYIGEGVALPHARVQMKRPYAFLRYVSVSLLLLNHLAHHHLSLRRKEL